MRLLLTLLVLLSVNALLLPGAQSERIDDVSFQPPFEQADKDGRRVINDTWIYGGNTIAKKHFVRLTADRQSQKGYIWANQPVKRETLSAVLTFRISGQAKEWFGDGLALWFTKHKGVAQHGNFGFTDRFTGLGVVVDTYVNKDHKGGHKDVTIQVNDGSKSQNQLNTEARRGCDAKLRYNDRNGSFDPVHSMSRLKVQIDRRRLVIEVDETASGKWQPCLDVTLPFDDNWLTDSVMGITAATGALADNHDVIRFDVFSEFGDTGIKALDKEVSAHKVTKDYKRLFESPHCGEDCLVEVLKKEFQNFRIEAEHRFTDLKEKIDGNVFKLKRQEKDNERRVDDLTSKVFNQIDSKVDVNVDAQVRHKVKTLNDNPDVINSASWKTPFALLFLAIAGGAVFVYRKYKALMKSHLL